jgi:hypothetical protein
MLAITDNQTAFTLLKAKQYQSMEELDQALEEWSLKYFQPINIRSSNCLKGEKYTPEDILKFEKKRMQLKCVHGGVERTSVKDNSRKNQATNNLDCPFQINVNFSKTKKVLEITNYNLSHNHIICKEAFEQYAQNRRLNEEQTEFCKDLFAVKGNIRDIQRALKEKFNKNVFVKDLYNLRSRLKVVNDLTEEEKLTMFLSKFKEMVECTIKIKLKDNKELECIFIQTKYMREWLEEFGDFLN